jgi:hypothetical protein
MAHDLSSRRLRGQGMREEFAFSLRVHVASVMRRARRSKVSESPWRSIAALSRERHVNRRTVRRWLDEMTPSEREWITWGAERALRIHVERLGEWLQRRSRRVHVIAAEKLQ